MVRMQRKHQQTGVMWSSEELNKEVACLSKLMLKGQPNMRISDFCFWINTDFLPNRTLELGFQGEVA